jgi:hypothetical protein
MERDVTQTQRRLQVRHSVTFIRVTSLGTHVRFTAGTNAPPGKLRTLDL